MTTRKKLGWSIVIGGVLGIVVGVVVISTLSTPAWLSMVVGVVAMGAGTFLGYAITQPNIPG